MTDPYISITGSSLYQSEHLNREESRKARKQEILKKIEAVSTISRAPGVSEAVRAQYFRFLEALFTVLAQLEEKKYPQNLGSIFKWSSGEELIELVTRLDDADNQQAREIKNEYRKLNNSLKKERTTAKTQAALLGEGTHLSPDGKKITVTRDGEGNVTVVTEFPDGSSKEVRYNDNSPDDVRVTCTDAAGNTTVEEKKGAQLFRSRDGVETTWSIDSESRLVREKKGPASDDYEKTTVNSNGSTTTWKLVYYDENMKPVYEEIVNPPALETSPQDDEKSLVEKATTYGESDNAEALQIRDEYRKAYQDAGSALEIALQLYKEHGPGQFEDSSGSSTTITKEGSTVTVTREIRSLGGLLTGRTDPDIIITVTFDENNPGDGEITTRKRNSEQGTEIVSTVKKVGSTLTISDAKGTVAYGMDDKGRVYRESSAGGKTVRTSINSDGSTEVITGTPGAEGTGTVEVHPPDLLRAEYFKMAREMSYVLNADGSHAALTAAQLETLVRGMSKYSIDVIRAFYNQGLKIAICDHTVTPQGGYPAGGGGANPEWVKVQGVPCGGYYSAGAGEGSDVIVLRLDCIENFSYVGTVVHELAHAIDDFTEPDAERVKYYTNHDPEVDRLYQAYKKRVSSDSSATWSSYALTNRQEYLAVALEFYMDPEKREILKTKDPDMYAYVETFLVKVEETAGEG